MRKKYYIRTFSGFAEQYGWSYEDIQDNSGGFSHWVRTTRKEVELRIGHNKLVGEFFKAKKIYEIDTNDPYFNLKVETK